MRSRLRELRSAKGWTQEELARRLDVTRQTIISLESGRYSPSLELAFRIAKAFGKRVEGVFFP